MSDRKFIPLTQVPESQPQRSPEDSSWVAADAVCAVEQLTNRTRVMFIDGSYWYVTETAKTVMALMGAVVVEGGS